MQEFSLRTPIGYLKGVGPQRAEVLNKELGVFTFQDLLYYFPFRYNDRSSFSKINQIDPQRQGVQFIARLVDIEIQG